MIITIDGPTASGKSTIAQKLAQSLNFYYLPTGWLYRAVSYLLVKQFNYNEIQLANPKAEDVATCLDSERLIYLYDLKKGGILEYNGNDITNFLKDYTVDRLVAIISPIQMVRDKVVETQRAFARKHNSVIEGRDSGSVVFPHADYKFYITATLEVRAKRWQQDQEKRGHLFDLEEAKAQINERDCKDLERDYCPLKVPEGAIEIDNSDIDLDQTVQSVLHHIKLPE
jgi:cytidylate kinase